MSTPTTATLVSLISLSSSSIDYNFIDGSFTYLSLPLRQSFTDITIDNLSANVIYVSIVNNNSITVNGSATQGVITINAHTTCVIVEEYFSRLRINMPSGSGNVQVMLELNQP